MGKVGRSLGFLQVYFIAVTRFGRPYGRLIKNSMRVPSTRVCGLLFTIGISGFFVYLAVSALYSKIFRLEMCLGWLIAFIFNALGLEIKIFAHGKAVKPFFVSLFIFNSMNALLFLGAIYLSLNHLPLDNH